MVKNIKLESKRPALRAGVIYHTEGKALALYAAESSFEFSTKVPFTSAPLEHFQVCPSPPKRKDRV